MFLFLLLFSLLSRELFIIPVDDIVEHCGERSPHKVGNDEIASDRIDVVECDPNCRRTDRQRYDFIESLRTSIKVVLTKFMMIVRSGFMDHSASA